MKCQILFSRKNKKNISNLSSAELAKRVVKVKSVHLASFPKYQGIYPINLHTHIRHDAWTFTDLDLLFTLG